jgi:hypothetical protein
VSNGIGGEVFFYEWGLGGNKRMEHMSLMCGGKEMK